MSFQKRRHIDDVHTLDLTKPVVEPWFVRGTDNGKNAGTGAFAEGFVDVGDHAQIANFPAGNPDMRVALL